MSALIYAGVLYRIVQESAVDSAGVHLRKRISPLENTAAASESRIGTREVGTSSELKFTYGGFIKGILGGVRCTKSLRVLFLHRRPPSWTTLVLYSQEQYSSLMNPPIA